MVCCVSRAGRALRLLRESTAQFSLLWPFMVPRSSSSSSSSTSSSSSAAAAAAAAEEEEEEEEEKEEESSDASDDSSVNTEANSSEVESCELESEIENESGSESECESASVDTDARPEKSNQQHGNGSIADIKSFSEALSSLCAQELDADRTQFSDELHVPLGTPLSSPHTVRRKQSGKQGATVMRIGEDGFSDSCDSSESSSENSSERDDGSNASDSESEYEYVYVTESDSEEEEEEESKCETQCESDDGSETNKYDAEEGVGNVPAAEAAAAVPPTVRQVDRVKDFESLSSYASRPHQAQLTQLCSSNIHAMDRTRIIAENVSSSSSAPSVEFTDESELQPESCKFTALRRDHAADPPAFNAESTDSNEGRAAHHADLGDSASSSSTGSGESVSSSSSSSAASDIDHDIDKNKNTNDHTVHSDSISTMSTGEAAAALEVYRVVEKPHYVPATTTTVEANVFVAKVVTDGVKRISAVVPRLAGQIRSSVNDGSSDDYKSISDLSS